MVDDTCEGPGGWKQHWGGASGLWCLCAASAGSVRSPAVASAGEVSAGRSGRECAAAERCQPPSSLRLSRLLE